MAVRTSTVGHIFSGLRLLQLFLTLALLVLLTLTTVKVNRVDPPRQPPPIIYSLIISVLLFLYILVTTGLHLTQRIHSWLNILALDALAAALSIPAAILLGHPLASISSCAAVADRNHHINTLGSIVYSLGGDESRGDESIPDAASKFGPYAGLSAMGDNPEEAQRRAGDYAQWVGRVGSVCAQMKGAWACALVLCIIFALSALAAWLCWRKGEELPEFEWDRENEGVVYIPETAGVGEGPALRGGQGGGWTPGPGLGLGLGVEMAEGASETAAVGRSKRSSEASYGVGNGGQKWPSEHV